MSMPLIPGEAPISKRRFPRWLIAFIAIIVAIFAWMIFANPFEDANNDTAIDGIDDNVVPAPIEDPAYVFYHNEDNKITRVTAPGGELLFDSGWDKSDHRSPDYDLLFNGGTDAFSVNRYNIDAAMVTPSGTIEGVTYLEVSVGIDKLVALVEAYNAIDHTDEEQEPAPGPPTIDAYDLLREVLSHSVLSDQALIKFITTGDPMVETNQVIAEAYAKGYSAWELYKGSPGFSYDGIDYKYRFTCTRYDVAAGNNDQMIEQLQSILPELDLTITVGSEQNPSPSRTVDFWDGGYAFVDSDEPCAAYPVEKVPPEPSIPTEGDYPEKDDPSDGVIDAPDDRTW